MERMSRLSILALLVSAVGGMRKAARATKRAHVNTTAAACASFSAWPDVDGVTCGEGSCTALVDTGNNGGRCDVYCASFGHTCAGAWEEEGSDGCAIAQAYQCNEAIGGTSDMLCKCVTSSSSSCASFSTWPESRGVTCGDCTALVGTSSSGGRCSDYCSSFGHTCAGVWEETDDTCTKEHVYGCDDAINSVDMLCKCVDDGQAPSPVPSPTPAPYPPPSPTPAPVPPPSPVPSPPTGGDACWDFLYWPAVDSVTCGSCTALIQAEAYGGRCDTYCESFGHTCEGAWEEVLENCEIKETYQCNQAISGTSDILCKCTGGGSLPPAPSAPTGETLVDTPCVSLMLVGDYGSRSGTQTRVASGMDSAAAQTSPVAIIGLGDNIYPNGAEDGPGDVVTWWKDIYTTKANLQLPWYAITGNHDWYSDARVQREFTTNSQNNFWQMPDFWYQHTFSSTVSGLKVDTFYIDTMVWIASRAPSYIGSGSTSEQKLWLDSALANSTADWKIVMGHHPVYSRGSHGVTSGLFNDLDPMMRRHGVQVYACGHDHSKHYIQHEGLSYVVNGAGGKDPRTPSNEYPVGSLVRDHQNPGFATLKVCKESAGELVYFDQDGSVQSTDQIPIAAPTSGLSGSVRLQNGNTLQFPSGRASAAAVATAANEMCGKHKMQQVDKFCKSENGSGCRVIADQPTYLTCQRYCEDNGLSCKNGWEQEDEDCMPTKELGCQTGSNTIDALICECMP